MKRHAEKLAGARLGENTVVVKVEDLPSAPWGPSDGKSGQARGRKGRGGELRMQMRAAARGLPLAVPVAVYLGPGELGRVDRNAPRKDRLG